MCELREKHDFNHVITTVLSQYVNQTTLSSGIPLSLVKTFSHFLGLGLHAPHVNGFYTLCYYRVITNYKYQGGSFNMMVAPLCETHDWFTGHLLKKGLQAPNAACCVVWMTLTTTGSSCSHRAGNERSASRNAVHTGPSSKCSFHLLRRSRDQRDRCTEKIF